MRTSRETGVGDTPPPPPTHTHTSTQTSHCASKRPINTAAGRPSGNRPGSEDESGNMRRAQAVIQPLVASERMCVCACTENISAHVFRQRGKRPRNTKTPNTRTMESWRAVDEGDRGPMGGRVGGGGAVHRGWGGLHPADSSSENTANTDVCQQHISLPTPPSPPNFFSRPATPTRNKNVAAGMKNT